MSINKRVFVAGVFQFMATPSASPSPSVSGSPSASAAPTVAAAVFISLVCKGLAVHAVGFNRFARCRAEIRSAGQRYRFRVFLHGSLPQ
jgi:hypothetical protein